METGAGEMGGGAEVGDRQPVGAECRTDRPGAGRRGAIEAICGRGRQSAGSGGEPDRRSSHALARERRDGRCGAAERGGSSTGRFSGSSSALLSGAGRPLDSSLRAFFEPRFGFDFSRVRIFSDEQAARSAQSIGALAYTAGPNIAFGGGLFQPGTGDGRRLLAHELTHVVQQGHAAAMERPRCQGR